jgi:hypothetical protein
LVALLDVNADGKLDMATASAETLSVWFGHGDATFAGGADSLFSADRAVFGPGDFNGDGKPDLAMLSCRAGPDGSLGVLLGQGDGTFGTAFSFPAQAPMSSVAVGDLDGDGKPDVVAASASQDTVGVFLASSDHKLTETDYATGEAPVAVAPGDLDGDGRLDIVTANQNATVSVLLGKGDGTLAAREDYATIANTAAVALGDLNRDGKLDIAAVGYSDFVDGKVSVLLGTGNGRLASHVDYAVGMNPKGLAFGDVNGDGKPDLVVANAGIDDYWSVSVLLGKGDGTLAPKVDLPSNPGPKSVVLTDLNGDGRLDIVLGNDSFGSYSLSVLLGKGDGTFPARVDYPGPVHQGWVGVGDVNGDGKLDITTASSVLFGVGDGTFPSRLAYSPAGGSCALADMNGDSRPDLVVVRQNRVDVWFNSCR